MKKFTLAAAAFAALMTTGVTASYAGSRVIVEQYGYGNSGAVNQKGRANRVHTYQNGRFNYVRSWQNGARNDAVVGQQGRARQLAGGVAR